MTWASLPLFPSLVVGMLTPFGFGCATKARR